MKSILKLSVVQQIIGTLILSSLGLNYGILYTWPSSMIILFASTNTTLNRPMTDTELALFGSLSAIGSMVGTFLSGFLLDYLGRKYTCFLCTIPFALAWVIIIVFSDVQSILIAMFISGFGGSLFTVTPVFISEICQEKIRGAMSACPAVFNGMGMLISYILGGYLDYYVMSYICLSITLISVVLVVFLKESPTFLMRKGSEKNAAKSIAFYRSTTVDSIEVLQEMSMIRKTLNPELDDAKPKDKNLNFPEKTPEKLSVMKYLKKSKSTRRGLMICMVLWSFYSLQGMVPVQVNAGPLFEQAMPMMSPYLTTIIFSLVSLISVAIAAQLSDVIGRRPLMIWPSIVAGVCCMVLGTQIHLDWGPHWINAVFLYGYIISYTLGAGTIPSVAVADLFLPEVRGVLTMVSLEWSWICNFFILFIFNPLQASVGLGPVFYLFSSMCFISAIFSFFFLPETKGLTIDVVQTLLVKRAY